MASDHTSVEMKHLPLCDFNSNHGVAAVDGKTLMRSSWAYMCENCFRACGVGLGLGKGQRLIERGK